MESLQCYIHCQKFEAIDVPCLPCTCSSAKGRVAITKSTPAHAGPHSFWKLVSAKCGSDKMLELSNAPVHSFLGIQMDSGTMQAHLILMSRLGDSLLLKTFGLAGVWAMGITALLLAQPTSVEQVHCWYLAGCRVSIAHQG